MCKTVETWIKYIIRFKSDILFLSHGTGKRLLVPYGIYHLMTEIEKQLQLQVVLRHW